MVVARRMKTQHGVVVRRSAQRAAQNVMPPLAHASGLAAILCVVAMAACSSAAPTAPASAAGSASASKRSASAPSASAVTVGDFNACAVLPAAELSKIVGSDAKNTPMPSAGWIAGQCAWSNAMSGFFLSVGTASSLQNASDLAAPDAEAKLAEFRQRTTSPKDITGVGDGAVLASTGMAAYKGPTYVEVTKLKLTDDQLIKILKLAVANL